MKADHCLAGELARRVQRLSLLDRSDAAAKPARQTLSQPSILSLPHNHPPLPPPPPPPPPVPPLSHHPPPSVPRSARCTPRRARTPPRPPRHQPRLLEGPQALDRRRDRADPGRRPRLLADRPPRRPLLRMHDVADGLEAARQSPL